MNWSFFFGKERKKAPQGRQEPTLTDSQGGFGTGRSGIRALPNRSACLMTPREMADWVQELYLAGALSWEDFAAAVPAEMHPHYNRTVGALTGQRARPDKPRDMLREWEEKLDFARRHAADDKDQIRQAQRILGLLQKRQRAAG